MISIFTKFTKFIKILTFEVDNYLKRTNFYYKILTDIFFFQNQELIHKNGIDKVYLICKPKDECFDEPLNNQESTYFKNKNVIKVLLDNELINYLNYEIEYSYSFDELLNVCDVNNDFIIIQDIPYFQSIGDIYLYFEYYINNRKYINVYNSNNIIDYRDFLVVKNIDNPLIKAYIEKSHGINLTNELRMFENNKYQTNYEMVLNYCE